MQFSRITLDILKNFATINQGIIFTPGNVLRSMSVMKNIFVTATIPDTIPQNFAIYDLNEFLATLSLLPDADITFEDEYLLFKLGKERVKYFYSSPSVVISPGEKSITMPEPDLKFTLEKSTFDQISRSSGVMKLKDISITNDSLTIFNRNNVGNEYSYEIDTEGETSDTILLKVENLKLIPLQYKVEVKTSGISHFVSEHEDYKIEYFIALDSSDD